MHIRYLSLTNFRNYTRLELTLPERPLLIHGANAQGKTNLLEAVCLLSMGTSPLASSDRELVKWEAGAEGLPYARVWAEIERDGRPQEIEVVLEKHRLSDGRERLQKTIRVDRARKRQAELAGRLNVVLFTPKDVELIAGSPSGRRQYVDDALSQVDPAYAEALGRYEDALRQRNAALRHLREQSGNPNQLQPFEDIIAHDGARIIDSRRRLLLILSRYADRLHQELTGGAEWLRLDYRPSFDPAAPPSSDYQMDLALDRYHPPADSANLQEQSAAFGETLKARRRQEIARGATTIGPHRDDIQFTSGSPRQGTHEVDLGTYGSRGQQRTAVLALKLAELDWMCEQTGDSPILLLDEVLAELDEDRRRQLISRVDAVEQALLTSTDLAMFNPGFRQRAEVWEVEGGIIHPEGTA
jgi:DNA replication and repair protein RecF